MSTLSDWELVRRTWVPEVFLAPNWLLTNHFRSRNRRFDHTTASAGGSLAAPVTSLLGAVSGDEVVTARQWDLTSST